MHRNRLIFTYLMYRVSAVEEAEEERMVTFGTLIDEIIISREGVITIIRNVGDNISYLKNKNTVFLIWN